MRHPLAVLATLCLGAAVPATPTAPPKRWPVMRYVRWQPGWGTRTIVVGGVSVRVGLKHCGADRPAGEGCWEGDAYPVASISRAGIRPATIEGDPGVGFHIGVGKLTPGATQPSLVVISDDGGSGGCVQIDLAVPDGAAYRTARLSFDPRDGGTICEVDPARLAWPRDLTGHGRAEFVFHNRVSGESYTSRAGEWRAPRVVAFDGRRGIDVSADPAVASLYRRDMARARLACERRVVEPAGPCAGYAADAALLGRLPQAMAVIRAQVNRGCRVRVPGPCPDSDRLPAGFAARLAAAGASPPVSSTGEP